MNPSIAFTIHDDSGRVFELLRKITVFLKEHFSEAFVVVTPVTINILPNDIEKLKTDRFFKVCYSPKNSLIGEHKKLCWEDAAKHSNADTVHLCDIDRLSYAVLNHERIFIKSLHSSEKVKTALLFSRSDKAWKTHPVNYYAIEKMASELSKILFNKDLDYGWCYLVVNRDLLKNVVNKLTIKEVGVYGELMYWLKNDIAVEKVDWLAWEDPFFFNAEFRKMKRLRELDKKEDEKRLGYVIPTVEFLLKKWRGLLQ